MICPYFDEKLGILSKLPGQAIGMDSSLLLIQAKQGDADAIATLITRALAPKGITARAVRHSYRLTIWLEAVTVPPQASAVAYVRQGIVRLQVPTLGTVLIYGQQTGIDQPAWSTEISLLDAVAENPFEPDEPLDQALIPSASAQAGGRGAAQFQTRPSSPVHSGQMPTRGRSVTQPVRAASRQPPFEIKWSDFDPMKLGIILFVAVYGLLGSFNPGYDGPFLWLHFPNLAIHETGHLLFMPFGYFLMLLGGSLTQIAFPAAFTAYFFWSRQFFSSALTLFWTGQNFIDVAVYMRDAPVRLLPLTVDDIDAHDWWNLFSLMGCLDQAVLIANLTHAIGMLIMLASVAAGLYFARIDRPTRLIP